MLMGLDTRQEFPIMSLSGRFMTQALDSGMTAPCPPQVWQVPVGVRPLSLVVEIVVTPGVSSGSVAAVRTGVPGSPQRGSWWRYSRSGWPDVVDNNQEMVRSTTQRCRPRRSLESTPIRAMRTTMPRLRR